MKERLIEILKADGYDIISACEIVQGLIDRMKESKPGDYKFYVGNNGFIVVRKHREV